jgi:hypothetical protein
MLISTWSPHFYRTDQADRASRVIDSLFIGPPGVMESDPNIVINLALAPDNYTLEEFERLDDAEQQKQLTHAKALSGRSELPIQMDEFPMFLFE